MIESFTLASLSALFVGVISGAVGLIRKNNSVADIAWGAGFVVIALSTFFLSEEESARRIIVTTLAVLWGTRLATRIYLKNLGKPEDFRYKEMRDKWGSNATIRSIFQVYVLQGFLMLVVASPIFIVNAYGGGPLNFLDYIGIFLWAVGFFFEAVGDYQLDKFIQNPENKGKIMMGGLWSLSRHPNYFGEIMMWSGMFLMAFSVSFGWLSVASPILISFLLLKVSGIPMLEKKWEGNPEFESYKKRTNALLPKIKLPVRS